MYSQHLLSLTALTLLFTPLLAGPTPKVYKHVLAFSVDGFHISDVDQYVAARPGSNIAKLLETGYEYTDAFTSAVCHGPRITFSLLLLV